MIQIWRSGVLSVLTEIILKVDNIRTTYPLLPFIMEGVTASSSEGLYYLTRTMTAVGHGFATGAVAGHYAFHLWKTLEKVITGTVKRILTSSLSLYYKGGFEQKMTGAKIRTGHRKMILNHPYKGRSPYLATKANEAKDYWNPVTKTEIQTNA
uniref:Uncharacterized protein n=1 Tax=Corvus moneduloides TaxID=1196302 RepID=A0A8C3E0X3_CORMO